MQRRVKKNWDYKILDSSGAKVIKPVEMTEARLKQLELDCVSELEEYIEDNDPLEFEDCDQLRNFLELFEVILDKYKTYHTDLKTNWGYEGYLAVYENRKQLTEKFRKYKRDINSRIKEVKKGERQHAEQLANDKETRERERSERQKTKLAHTAKTEQIELKKLELEAERLAHEKKKFQQNTEVEEKKCVVCVEAAKEKLLHCLDEPTGLNPSILDFERSQANILLSLDAFRVAHAYLLAILGDRYEEKFQNELNTFSESAKTKLSEIKQTIRDKEEIQGKLDEEEKNANFKLAKEERDANFKSKKILGEQTVMEIKMRCAALVRRVNVTLATLPDSQLLHLNKELQQLTVEASKILDKTTDYAKYVSDLGASDQLVEINKLITDTFKKKEAFVLAVRKEMEVRDLSEEKIKNAAGLNIKIPKFTGYESQLDIYTFQTQFDKIVKPYTQKPLLADALILNYLGEPALSLVKDLKDIDEIWERLTKSYGDYRVLLQKKLGRLSKMGGLEKIRGKENLIFGISELVNNMAELKRLAEAYHLENKLYYGGGLDKVKELMGEARRKKFKEQNLDSELSEQETWIKIETFLKRELKLTQELVVDDKSRQPICLGQSNSEKPKYPGKLGNKNGNFDFSGNTNVSDGTRPVCEICGKNDHKSYVGPYGGQRKVSYLACEKFLKLSPLERGKILENKGLCRQCLRSGAKKGHPKFCSKTYVCTHQSHNSDSEGYHVLVCDKHKHTTENAKLLKQFKDEYILKFEKDLPPSSKNVKIMMHNRANCAGTVSAGDEDPSKGIFMLQTINVEGETFNLFYDSGCSDLVCKQSAIDKLVSLGRASLELPGPITLSGVGDSKTICKAGVYSIQLPLSQGNEATMSGLCLDKVTGKFPEFSLRNAERDIKNHCRKIGKGFDGKLPRLPGMVGGETDIMIGIKYLKYFPREIFKLPNGLTIYEAAFNNSDGTLGVVAGPHPSFSIEWDKMGQVAYSYEVMPEVTQYQHVYKIGMDVPLLGWGKNLKNPDHDPNVTPTTATYPDVLTTRRAPKISHIFDKLENAGTEITYRCKDCRECPECKKSDRFESISIQEEIEQTVIEKSVNVDITKGRTIAKLPFLSNPVHKLRPNKGIALRVYQSQLKRLEKNPLDKDQVLKSENKLNQLGFVDFVENLCDKDRNMILNSEVKYFIPWRAVWNENSLSTPCRLVFDASQTTKDGCSLNDILAKGTNNMNKLVEIFIRWSIRACAFHTDIQKMYNAIRLDKSHWNYQLYLWSDSFDINDPKWKVIKTLIYGVKSSGNQAECGLRSTAKKLETGHERASEVVHKDIYVDDCISGDEGPEQVRVLTDDLEIMLKKGGFDLKGITFSGSDPPDHLSEDGESILVGGLRWFSKTDQLKLNLGDFNFSKKQRGRKAQAELGRIPENFTRRDCVSKVAEVFDPLGKVAPIIGGMKLDLHDLISRNLDWDDLIPPDLKDLWLKNFETIQGLREVTFNRAIVPSNAKNLKICTLDTADASNQLICVAIYARFSLTNGEHTCQLVFARTKIVPKDMSVPRAELLAATLNATTGHVVKTSFGKYFERSMKLTDSQIALFWINSTRSELKLWARNRVIEINRLTDANSWRYVRSSDMIADLGTRKGALISDMGQSGEWINGKPWMSLPECDFPVSTVSQITLSNTDKSEASNECNKPDITDQVCSVNSWWYAKFGMFSGSAVPDQVKSRYEFSQYVIDPNRFRLRKIIRILGLVFLFIKNCYMSCTSPGFVGKLIQHTKVTTNIVPAILSCEGDQYIVTTGGQNGTGPFKCPAGRVVRVSNDEIKLALTYLFRKATEEVKQFVDSRSYNSISTEIEGILYYTGRILPSMEERVGPQLSDVMFDLSKTTFCVPITDKHSPIAYSIVNEVHSHHPDVKHSGVETTLRHVQLMAYVIGGRELVKKYGKNCTRCRILNKNTVKVLMGPLHEGQLKVAPAFCRTQVDLFGPFTSYDLTNKRKPVKIWFVIFCCVTTSAVDIRVMEDYSTEAFLLAFVRFACRVGFPKMLLPDEGSQLVKGCQTMILRFTDIKNRLYTEYGVEFEVCPVGAHYMHGKVERKIQQVKKSITINMESNRLSVLQWESLVAQVANGINNLPLGLGNKVECLEDLDIITPNRLLLGRNNNRCPSGPLTAQHTFKRMLDMNKNIYDTWFQSWLKSYVPSLIDRPKWLTTDTIIKIGDVVLFLKSEKEFERDYQYGIIHTVNVGRDGHIRVVEVEYQNHNEGVKRYTTRGVRDLVVIQPLDEPGINAELAEIAN